MAATPRTGPDPVPLLLGCCLTAAGGAVGAVARWGLQNAFPASAGQFPWTTFLINVIGCALLAALPLALARRRRAWLGVLVGPGLLGGFTTMSAASVETVTLARGDHVAIAAAYCLGTLAAALIAVVLVDRVTTAAERAAADTAWWNE
jgi:fluoride exporter